jgi:prolyl-tRNA editing enzyme YbaK/EbsC (Cys-tRNA(Pro) deacylase)
MNYHPVVNTILQQIKDNNFWHETFEHEPVITSEDAAKLRHGYKLEQGAKAIIAKVESKENDLFVMFVLPGNLRLDSSKIRKNTGIRKFRFANEAELSQVTNGVERGGVPPFGTLFNLKTYVDQRIFDLEKIIFNAGDRSFSIAMKSEDYKKIVNPEIVDIA